MIVEIVSEGIRSPSICCSFALPRLPRTPNSCSTAAVANGRSIPRRKEETHLIKVVRNRTDRIRAHGHPKPVFSAPFLLLSKSDVLVIISRTTQLSGISKAVKDRIPFRVRPMLATLACG
jgi:hypothetical protein